MDSEPGSMILRAIGVVRNGITPPKQEGWGETISEIVIDSSLSEALDGLEEFSHIIVLFWMHQITPEGLPMKVHPMGRQELPLVGRLATRSPRRPNPIGETVVRLLERQKNILKVEGLDAFDGTPVIDIKPYIPGNGSVADARVPSWITK
jgi:tRNA-Thr(GGU) m(6)t(6)A37 methyltransferase TsaA